MPSIGDGIETPPEIVEFLFAPMVVDTLDSLAIQRYG